MHEVKVRLASTVMHSNGGRWELLHSKQSLEVITQQSLGAIAQQLLGTTAQQSLGAITQALLVSISSIATVVDGALLTFCMFHHMHPMVCRCCAIL
jgi:hypothetical protein